MTGPIGAHLPLKLSNFLLNQTGLALDPFMCMIMSNNLSRLILQTAVIYHQACQLNMKSMRLLCHTIARKQWQKAVMTRNPVSWHSEDSFFFLFKVKNKLTPDIKYYKLRISSTSPPQYGVLHIPSEALLLVWSADTWSRLTCPHHSLPLIGDTQAASLTQQTGPALPRLTCLLRGELRCFHMPHGDSKWISPLCVLHGCIGTVRCSDRKGFWD